MEHLAYQPQGPSHRLHRQLRDRLHDRRQNDAEVGQDGRWAGSRARTRAPRPRARSSRTSPEPSPSPPSRRPATTLTATRPLPCTWRARPTARRRIRSVNFKITRGGSETIMGGVSAETFYTPSDPGILSNLYIAFTSYTIPEPAVM